MPSFTEITIEEGALEWFTGLGYTIGHGPQFAPGEHAGGTLTPALSQVERESYVELVLVGLLREAIRRLNPAIPEEARATFKRYLKVQIERRPNP